MRGGLERRDAVLHGAHLGAHADAQAVARAHADGARSMASERGHARVPVHGVGEVRDEREGVVDAETRLDGVAPAWSSWLHSRAAVIMAAEDAPLPGVRQPEHACERSVRWTQGHHRRCPRGDGRRAASRRGAAASANGCSHGRRWRMGRCAGRTVLVTGPTSGLGRAATDALAELGARVILAGRSAGASGARARRAGRSARRGPVPDRDRGHRVARVRAGGGRPHPRDRVATGCGGGQRGRHLPGAHRGPRRHRGRRSRRSSWGRIVLVDGLLPLLRARRPDRRSSRSRRGACTPRRCRSTTWDSRAARTRARGHTPGRSGPRWRSFASGRAGGRDRLRRALQRDAPGLGGHAGAGGVAAGLPPADAARCCGPPRRVPTRSLWLAADPAATAGSGRLFLDRRPRPFDRIPSTRLSAADRRVLWDAVRGLAGLA